MCRARSMTYTRSVSMLQRISDWPAYITYSQPNAADVGPPSAGITFAGIVTILRRRQTNNTQTTQTVVALTLAVIFAVRPLYTGTASVLIDPHRQEVINLNENTAALRSASTDEAAVQSQVLLMQSAEVLRRVVKEQNLTADPDFTPQPRFLGPLKKQFSSGHKAEGLSAQDFAVMNSVDVLQKRLKVERQQNSYLVDINVRSHDPNKAAHVADAVAGAYLAELVKAKVDSVKVAAGWMDQQLNELKSRGRGAGGAGGGGRARRGRGRAQGGAGEEQ